MQINKLYVGNLSYSVGNEQLKQLFSGYGEVKEVRVIEGKGFGFVEMSSSQEAEHAREALNGADFEGRTMKVDEARPPKERTDGSLRGRPRGDYQRGSFRRY